MRLSDFVYNERVQRHMTQRDLSEASHISRAEVSRIEKGERKNPSVKVLTGLSQAFGITVKDVLVAIEKEQPPVQPTKEADTKVFTQEKDDPIAVTSDGTPYLELRGLTDSQIRVLVLKAYRMRQAN